MPEPIDFRIIKNLQTTLRAISKTATPAYHHTVSSVGVKLDADHNVEDLVASMVSGDPQNPIRPFILLELLPDSWEYQPADQVLPLIPFSVHFVNDSDPTLDEALLQEYLRACADIEQAIAVDHGRGVDELGQPLAVDTRIITREMHELSGRIVWSTVTAAVKLYREYGKPNG